MFTGLVEETGSIRSVRRVGRSLHLTVSASTVLQDAKIGDSIAVSGVCLTVVRFDRDSFTADVMPETYEKTSLGALSIGAAVNLERTMAVGDRFGGHIVQGHVDGLGLIQSLKQDEIAWRITIESPPDLLKYIAPKGSITVDGISLTVIDVGESTFSVSLIPHTWAMTSMKQRKVGDRVNLEVDILAKYVERMLSARMGSRVTEEFLRENGFSDNRNR